MLSINANITVANHAPVIARRGTDDVFCELSFRRLGALIELVCTRVEYTDLTGRYIREELGREVVEEEDAENVACDLEWLAVENLEATVGDKGYCDTYGFDEAVENELMSVHAIAAE